MICHYENEFKTHKIFIFFKYENPFYGDYSLTALIPYKLTHI
jgi:hypothetical protein